MKAAVKMTSKRQGHVRAGRYPQQRRHFLRNTTFALLAPGGLGLVAGACMDHLESIVGVSPASADSFVPAERFVPTAPALPAVTPADTREWVVFRRRFISADGRVIDTGNDCVSHTEGQGYGMLMAVAVDDRPTFDKLYAWTRSNLGRPSDSLFSWRYEPDKPNPVSDTNNATDGDLLIAWALWQASYRWNHEPYAVQARQIAQDILSLLVVDVGARTVLLPGVDGFANGNTVTVNLSYYIFPAMRDLAQAVPSPQWGRVVESGLVLMDTGRFGRWMLPPDWLAISRVTGALSPAAGWPARFSYDAMRIPLYLAWGGHSGVPAQQAFLTYWSQTAPNTPAWVNVVTGDTATYTAGPGMVAIAGLARDAAMQAKFSQPPSIHTARDYYSAALMMMSRLAANATLSSAA